MQVASGLAVSVQRGCGPARTDFIAGPGTGKRSAGLAPTSQPQHHSLTLGVASREPGIFPALPACQLCNATASSPPASQRDSFAPLLACLHPLHRLVSYGITLYRIVSCRVVYISSRIVSYGIASSHIVSYRIASYGIVSYRIVLYCVVLYCIALYCIASRCIVLYCIVSYRIVYVPCV